MNIFQEREPVSVAAIDSDDDVSTIPALNGMNILHIEADLRWCCAYRCRFGRASRSRTATRTRGCANENKLRPIEILEFLVHIVDDAERLLELVRHQIRYYRNPELFPLIKNFLP